MNKHVNIIIAGAGGIAEAVGLILAEHSKVSPTLFIGNRTLSKAQEVAHWIEKGTAGAKSVGAFELDANALSEEAKAIFQQGDILLDCLPGGLAPANGSILQKTITCIMPTLQNMLMRQIKYWK